MQLAVSIAARITIYPVYAPSVGVGIIVAAIGFFFLRNKNNSHVQIQSRQSGIQPPLAHVQAAPLPSQRLSKTKIFISYRRSDNAPLAERIYDQLVQTFGKEAIFKDVDSIPFGLDFRKYLNDAVARCDVLLAVIGGGWVGATDEKGQRRLDNPLDFVRIEIEAALKRDIPVIPILVAGAKMPETTDLPQSLQDLIYRNGTVVRNDPDFHHDVGRLIHSLQQYTS